MLGCIFCPVHTHAISNDTYRCTFIYHILRCLKYNSALTKRQYIITCRLYCFGFFRTRYFAPVEAFMFQHHHRVAVKEGRFYKPLYISSITWIGYFNTFDSSQCAFHAAAMVRATAAISTYRYTQYHGYRELTAAEIAGFADLCY